MSEPSPLEETNAELEQLLAYLRDEREFDFSGYKRASLGRRIAKRMQMVGIDDFREYQRFLEAQPHEFVELFNTILINVTSFLRDREAWEYIAEQLLPRLLGDTGEDQAVRAWSAGCATGEEAYSLAVILCEYMGADAFRTRAKVYGTDADEGALTVARQGRYTAKAVHEAFTDTQVERYFEPDGDTLTFRKDVRRSVIFGRHDLVQDPPISRVDLLVCRNTLMYFNSDTQQRILANFQFALNEGGYLFLGKSEALVTSTKLFAPVDLQRHVFEKRTALLSPRRPMQVGQPRSSEPPGLGDLTFESAPVAQIAVDRNGVLVLANRHARTLFGLGLNQVGRPFKDVELSYRPLELRSRIEQVLTDRRPSTVNDVELVLPGGSTEFLDISLMPLNWDGQAAAVALTFLEVGRYKLLREEVERSQRELEAAYEELQSINEELETTNEELQSTNEELETTNEELHSTNEELETMNEELQSTNEELETTNNEARQRGLELDEANVFLASILGSLDSSVIVLNRDLAVRVWNRRSEDMWGLRSDEVQGQYFLNLDIGLPVDKLSEGVRAAVSGRTDVPDLRVGAVNRRGRTMEFDVRFVPLMADGTGPDGVIVLIDPLEAVS
ncbi:MAG: methyltransferase, CheR-type with sensor [Acidimicrobiales bacterium]|nr:methyltransferase, CheR-type with sensor [Acidimicrobiales bacterium]